MLCDLGIRFLNFRTSEGFIPKPELYPLNFILYPALAQNSPAKKRSTEDFRIFGKTPLKMDLQTRKLELIREFLKIQSEEILAQLESILKKEGQNSEIESNKPMTIDEFNARIDQSMDDSENGRLMESSELKSKIDKWI